MSEIIFEVTEDEVDGGYSASAIGYGIHTQGDSMDEIRRNVKEAIDCYFDLTTRWNGPVSSVCILCAMRFSSREVASECQRSEVGNRFGALRIGGRTPAGLARQDHHEGRGQAPRGHSVPPSDPRQDPVEHPQKRRATSPDDRR